MKSTLFGLLAVVALLASVNGAVINSVDGIENEIDLGAAFKLFYNSFKKVMPCGFAPYDMPALAPYLIPHLEWNTNNNIVNTQGKLSNIVVNGLDRFQILDLTYNSTTKRMTFDAIFSEMQILAEFTMNTTVYLNSVPINWAGDGVLNTKIFDYRFVSNNLLAPTAAVPNGLEITDLHDHTYVGDVVFNNWNNEWDVAKNNFINNFAREYVLLAVQEMQPQILDLKKEFLLPMYNKFLKNFNEETLVGFLLEQTMQLEEAACMI